METIIIAVAVGGIAFIIGLVAGGSSCQPVISPYWDYDIKSGKLAALETRVFILESENKRLNYLYESLTRDKRMFHEYMAAHCSSCGRNFYAKSLKEQEVADMLKKITLTSEEIAAKLDIKITH